MKSTLPHLALLLGLALVTGCASGAKAVPDAPVMLPEAVEEAPPEEVQTDDAPALETTDADEEEAETEGEGAGAAVGGLRGRTAPKKAAAKAAAPAPGAANDCGEPEDCNTAGANALLQKDVATAAVFFQKACDGGIAGGCSNVAKVYLGNFDESLQDFPAAFAAFAKGCDTGDPESCNGSGFLKIKGIGTDRDPKDAFGFFERACTKDHGEACNNAAILLYNGEGIPSDKGKAAGLFKKACQHGNDNGCRVTKQLEEASAPKAAKGEGVSGANLTVESLTVDGFTVTNLSCRLNSGGFFAGAQLVGSLAAKQKSIRKCGKASDNPRVTWSMDKGKTRDVTVTNVSKKVERCVAKSMKRVQTTLTGSCAATFKLGK